MSQLRFVNEITNGGVGLDSNRTGLSTYPGERGKRMRDVDHLDDRYMDT